MIGNNNNLKILLYSDLTTIETYPILLDQILMNLFSNSLKYNHTKIAEIELYVSENPSHYLFIVKELIELMAVIIIIIGVLKGIRIYLKSLFFKKETSQYYFTAFRIKIARAVAQALELTIAGDVIATTTNPNYHRLALLMLTIVIRTFINYMLTKEMNDIPDSIRKKIEGM